jgi:alpha-L-rhamnosidase
MGGYDNWFYNTLAGIQPDPHHAGFRHFFLAPCPIAGLKRVRASYDSPWGQIASDWSFANGVFEWTIVIPRSTRATATMPFTGSVRELGPGRHTFVAKHNIAAGSAREGD